MNPLYKDVRGKTILDFYSEYDLNMLGVSLKDVHTDTDTDDWGKVWGLYDNAKTIEDKDL